MEPLNTRAVNNREQWTVQAYFQVFNAFNAVVGSDLHGLKLPGCGWCQQVSLLTRQQNTLLWGRCRLTRVNLLFTTNPSLLLPHLSGGTNVSPEACAPISKQLPKIRSEGWISMTSHTPGHSCALDALVSLYLALCNIRSMG